MVDGKIVSTMLDEASANCNFCSATPKQMQDVKSCKKRKLNSAALAFGLSSLHMWMRCAEYLLKISYRMNIKLARIRKNSPEKAKELAEKRRIQTECYNRLGGDGMTDGSIAISLITAKPLLVRASPITSPSPILLSLL